MAKALFSVLFKVIKAIANVILAPINLLVVNLLPNFSSLIATFNNAVSTFINNGVMFFFNILPSNARALVILWLTFLVSYYSISLSIHFILKVYKLIKQIKIW